MFSKKINQNGFTLIETLIALLMVGLMSVAIMSLFINTTNIQFKIANNQSRTEMGRDILDRITREVRGGVVDYKGYYVQNHYDDFFDPHDVILYYENDLATSFPVGDPDIPKPFLSQNNDEIFLVDELMVLNHIGTLRTKFRREVINNNGTIFMTQETYKVPIFPEQCALNMNGNATYPSHDNWDSRNGIVADPCWITASDFSPDRNNGWKAISSDNINVMSLDFYISPNRDPWKVYGIDEIQRQPQVMILMTIETSDKNAEGLIGNNQVIAIQNSTSIRILDSVDWNAQ